LRLSLLLCRCFRRTLTPFLAAIVRNPVAKPFASAAATAAASAPPARAFPLRLLAAAFGRGFRRPFRLLFAGFAGFHRGQNLLSFNRLLPPLGAAGLNHRRSAAGARYRFA